MMAKAWRRERRNIRVAHVAAWLIAGGVLLAPRWAWGNASGCTFHPASTPGEAATCVPGGDGCYICEYYYQDGGFTTCSEYPDGTIPFECVPGLHALNQYSGSHWTPAAPAPPGDGHPAASRRQRAALGARAWLGRQ